jgi:predicted Zn-dependent peptidase
MATIPTSPPQKKMENPNEEVMRVKEALKQVLTQNNIQPQIIANLGKMAFASIKNKALYPMVVQQAQQLQLINNNIKKGYDYKVLSTLVVIGKLSEMIMQESAYG